jgi:hypothetical protein
MPGELAGTRSRRGRRPEWFKTLLNCALLWSDHDTSEVRLTAEPLLDPIERASTALPWRDVRLPMRVPRGIF